MQLNKLGGDLAPSARKIQSTITDVIEHFKNLGYTPRKGVLERTPDADCYISKYLGQRAYGYEGAADITEHCYKPAGSSTPKQKLHSFKQFGCSEEYCMSQCDYNEKGQVIRHIFKDEPRFNREILIEYEYTGNKVTKEIKYYSNDRSGSRFKEIKTINPETGHYTIERTHPESENIRDIEHYNDKHQQIQKTRISKWDKTTSTRKTFFDPESCKTTGVEIVYDNKDGSYKIIQKAEIDPNTGKLNKFSSIYEGEYGPETCCMFEKDSSGRIVHFIDDFGNEVKYNSLRKEFDVVPSNGETYTLPSDYNSQILASIKSYDSSLLDPSIKKYL